MANSKGKRPQKQKSKINKGSDPNRIALSLRNGDGPHKSPKAYSKWDGTWEA